MRLVNRLPLDHQAAARAGSAANTKPLGKLPTHLLDCASATAVPLHAAAAVLPLQIRSRDDGVYLVASDDNLLVNGKAARDGAALSCGDQISHGDTRYQLIAVEP